MMTEILGILIAALLSQNFILVKFYGICPFMGVSKKIDTALGMGMAVTFVMALASFACWLVNELLLMLNLVPAGWKDVLYWDGARLHALWHSNVTACFFMVGIGIAATFLVQAKKRISKVLLAAAMAIQFAAMAMTNCRTTILMTGALLGGIVFFQLCRKGGWKRLLLGLMAAAVILAGSFKLAGKIYQWNNDRIAAGIQQMIASGDKQKLKDYQFYVTKDGQVVMNSNNQQKSLSQDMRTLNGRTSIWAAANQVLQDDEEIKHWGTPYVSTILSAYNWFPVEHSHNSWVETVMRTGVTGLVLALFYTALSIWYAARLLLSRDAELWKQILAMTTMCLLVTGFLEPYLFITDIYYHVTNFLFFFLTGYLDHWCSLLPRRKK